MDDDTQTLGKDCETVSTWAYSIRKTVYIRARADASLGQPVKLVLVHRDKQEDTRITLPVHTKRARNGQVMINATIPCDEIVWKRLAWDIFFVFSHGGQETLRQATCQSRLAGYAFYFGLVRSISLDDNLLIPFLAQGMGLALMFRNRNEYDRPVYYIKEIVAYLAYLCLRPFWKKRKIWIVYEKLSNFAQDNAYYFFKYCQNAYHSKNIYYIIDKRANDYARVKEYGSQVLGFMSFRHMLYSISAQLVVSSESVAHAFSWRRRNSIVLKKLRQKPHVFLQHGVIGFKQVHMFFQKTRFDQADLFITSSDYEKQIILDYFGYRDEEIIVTGLCRWDAIKDKSEGRREILIMPTWRTQLDDADDAEFLQSDYYARYAALLDDPLLHELMERYDLTLNFYMHPKFHTHSGSFKAMHPRVHVISQQPLNELLMQCRMLITDYSSVAWDVYYQNKPIIFYQFDFEEYKRTQGSYMDMETELIGDRALDSDKLMEHIEHYCKNGFAEKDVFRDRRPAYFKYQDRDNCRRIYEEIVSRFGAPGPLARRH